MQPSAEDIREQLTRILAHHAFVSSDRLSRFLRYVVERTLAGEGDRLKEYVIGMEVFDRDERYDPRVDSIVRVEAGRLRAKVDAYYSQEGATDAVIIRLRRGSYAPEFERRTSVAMQPVDANSASSRPHARLGLLAAVLVLAALGLWYFMPRTSGEAPLVRPSVVVLPFVQVSGDPADQQLATQVTDGVTSELVRAGTLSVVPRSSARQFAGSPPLTAAKALDVDVVMEANVRRDGERLQIEARLVDPIRNRKLWVDEFSGTTTEMRELQRRIAAAAAEQVGRTRSDQ